MKVDAFEGVKLEEDVSKFQVLEYNIERSSVRFELGLKATQKTNARMVWIDDFEMSIVVFVGREKHQKLRVARRKR